MWPSWNICENLGCSRICFEGEGKRRQGRSNHLAEEKNLRKVSGYSVGGWCSYYWYALWSYWGGGISWISQVQMCPDHVATSCNGELPDVKICQTSTSPIFPSEPQVHQPPLHRVSYCVVALKQSNLPRIKRFRMILKHEKFETIDLSSIPSSLLIMGI